MKHYLRLLCALSMAVFGAQSGASAHFKLLEPASWLVEGERGDPQKAGPCGGTNTDAGVPSNIIGKVTGGQKLHVKVMETVYHPGHYRIALAVNNREELPTDSEVVTREGGRGPSRYRPPSRPRRRSRCSQTACSSTHRRPPRRSRPT